MADIEPIKVNHEYEADREMAQWREAMSILSGFMCMIQPLMSKEIAISRVRFYNELFETVMNQAEEEKELFHKQVVK